MKMTIIFQYSLYSFLSLTLLTYIIKPFVFFRLQNTADPFLCPLSSLVLGGQKHICLVQSDNITSILRGSVKAPTISFNTQTIHDTQVDQVLCPER